MRINFGNSLRLNVENRIKTEHPEISQFGFSGTIRYKKVLLSRDGYGWIAMIVVTLLILGAIAPLPYLDLIKLETGTAATLIDQRTSNVATIISMCLTVTSVLFSNLAIKDRRTYKLAFEGTMLYVLIYYSLSLIIFLIIISTLRNTFSQDLYNRLVLSATYLTLLIPLGIVYLFRDIIKFVNQEEILSRFKDEYRSEVKTKLYLHLLHKFSEEEFVKMLERVRIKEYEFDFGTISETTAEESEQNGERPSILKVVPFVEQPNVLVVDIDLPKLEMLLRECSPEDKLFYTATLSINSITNNHYSFIWPIPQRRNGTQINFSKCIWIGKIEKQLQATNLYEDYFIERLEEAFKENKVKKIEEVLELLTEINELEMKYE